MPPIHARHPSPGKVITNAWKLGHRSAVAAIGMLLLVVLVLPASPGGALGLFHLTSEPSASTVTVGMSVTDTATVTGHHARFFGGATPKGEIQFYICGPVSKWCGFSDASALGKPVALVPGPTGSHSATATSPAYTPAETGKYCFIAVYQNANFWTGHFGSDRSGSQACFTVVQATQTPVSAFGAVGLVGVTGCLFAYRVRRHFRRRPATVKAS